MSVWGLIAVKVGPVCCGNLWEGISPFGEDPGVGYVRRTGG